jgi:hypothetical protein
VRDRKEKQVLLPIDKKEVMYSAVMSLSPFLFVGLFADSACASVYLALGLSLSLDITDDIIRYASNEQYGLFGASRKVANVGCDFVDYVTEQEFHL